MRFIFTGGTGMSGVPLSHTGSYIQNLRIVFLSAFGRKYSDSARWRRCCNDCHYRGTIFSNCHHVRV